MRDMNRNGFAGWVLALSVAWVIAAGIGWAGVFHDETAGTLVVTDFPAEMPCTLEQLCRLDVRFGWGKATYDRTSDTYTVSCGLRIGANDGTETYFQIGSPAHPKETLVMKGNLVVYPYAIKGQNRDPTFKDGYGRIQPDAARQKINRLTIGDAADSAIRPVLKFVCAKPGEFGLTVGRADGYGGQCHAYHALLTAAAPKPAGAFKIAWGGDSVILEGSTISWVAGNIGYGWPEAGTRINDCIFENAEAATYNGGVRLTGCTLRNLETAVADSGSLTATLTDCVFENNTRNYSLPNTAWGLTCIDCTFGPARQPDMLRASKRTDGQMRLPYVRYQRHIIVEVTDSGGAPLPRAQVTVFCEQDVPEAVANGKQLTDAAGRTPDQHGKNAILLTESCKKATANPEQPEERKYTFAIEAGAAGYSSGRMTGWRPMKSWDVVRIALNPK